MGGEHASSGLNREQGRCGWGEAGQQWAPQSASQPGFRARALSVDTCLEGILRTRAIRSGISRGPLWTVVVFEPDLEKLRSLGGVGSPVAQDEVVREEAVSWSSKEWLVPSWL